MGHTHKEMKDESDLNCVDSAQKVSEENISKWSRDHACDILAKDLAAFCPC